MSNLYSKYTYFGHNAGLPGVFFSGRFLVFFSGFFPRAIFPTKTTKSLKFANNLSEIRKDTQADTKHGTASVQFILYDMKWYIF